jgi:SAM-dependent methyltransferase
MTAITSDAFRDGGRLVPVTAGPSIGVSGIFSLSIAGGSLRTPGFIAFMLRAVATRGTFQPMKAGKRPFSYDSIAAEYATKVDNAPYNALYERPAMLSMLPSVHGLRILDAGCGSGWYSERLLERGAIVEAIDASEAMVAYARSRFENLSPYMSERIHVQRADLGDRLPFDSESFDGAVSPLVLHYLADWRPALGEIRRVLRDDGWLLFSTHHPAADAALFKPANYFATELVHDHWDWAGDVSFYRRSLTEIFRSLRDTGFVITNFVEPHPTEELRATRPDSYESLMALPQFVIVEAKKA